MTSSHIQVLTPISLPTPVPCIFAVRPMTTFTMPLLVCTGVPKTSSIGPAVILPRVAMSPGKLLAVVGCAARTCATRSYTAFAPAADGLRSPTTPMCTKNTLRWSNKKVVEQRHDFQASVERRAHRGIHLVFEQHRVTHHHRHRLASWSERRPGGTLFSSALARAT